jgi:hypothetical protein
MPHPADLRAQSCDGTTFVTAGQMVIACYPDGDIAMRNVAVAVARQLGFSGQHVAEVMGLSASYVATLHQRAVREGAAGLIRPSGPKPKLSPQAWARGGQVAGRRGQRGADRRPPGRGPGHRQSAPGRRRAAGTAVGDRHGEGLALEGLGLALHAARRSGEAITVYQDAIAIYRQTGDRYREGMALNHLERARTAQPT